MATIVESQVPGAPKPEVERPRSFLPSSSSSSFRLQLTKRETEVLQLVADGLINKQIAPRLHGSQGRIERWGDAIRLKLHATNRAHAASIGLRFGLID